MTDLPRPTIDAVWRSKRKGETNRKVLITAVIPACERFGRPFPERVAVRRNTSNRAQSMTVKTLLRDYVYSHQASAKGSPWPAPQ